MKLHFLGAAGEVTGSSYLVETGDVKFLVDCGMFQGGHEAEEKNLSALKFDVGSLDFVLLTHAHIDHSGLLPRLCALGFKGPIYATEATCDLLGVMLLDSAHIQEGEAERENRKRGSRGGKNGAVPLYTTAQAESALEQLRQVKYDADVNPGPGIRCRYRDAGHILGSAMIECWITQDGPTRKIVFSGDIGQPGRPIMHDPTPIAETDYLLTESTYGNRLHKVLPDTERELVEAIKTTFKNGGNVIIPAFAVGRTQEVLHELTELTRRNLLHDLSVYVDSPMALKATQITMKYRATLDDESRTLLKWQEANPKKIRIQFTQTVEDSMALNNIKRGAIIIAASGMCDAGRIRHHLRHNLPRSECSVIFVGFQAEGSLGRRLVDGAKTVTIFGEEIPVCARMYTIGGLSAHADQKALLDWLGHFKIAPKKTFIIHGESANREIFADKVRELLGWKEIVLPLKGQAFEI
ncbi:MAG: MBL fold metallo-hydrolase [Burkholderiales bacterium]